MKRKKKESDGNKYKSSKLENGRDIEEEASLNKGNIVTEEPTIHDEGIIINVFVSFDNILVFFRKEEFWSAFKTSFP